MAGRDRLAGESSDIRKPATHSGLSTMSVCRRREEEEEGGGALTCAVQPQGGGVEDGSPGGGVMSSGLVHRLCCVEGASWTKRRTERES